MNLSKPIKAKHIFTARAEYREGSRTGPAGRVPVRAEQRRARGPKRAAGHSSPTGAIHEHTGFLCFGFELSPRSGCHVGCARVVVELLLLLLFFFKFFKLRFSALFCTTALAHAPSHLTERATHAHPLHPAALASVSYGKVLVRVRVHFGASIT